MLCELTDLSQVGFTVLSLCGLPLHAPHLDVAVVSTSPPLSLGGFHRRSAVVYCAVAQCGHRSRDLMHHTPPRTGLHLRGTTPRAVNRLRGLTECAAAWLTHPDPQFGVPLQRHLICEHTLAAGGNLG